MEHSTTVLLIRHAHVTTGPGAGRLCGWLDVPLSTRGEQQLDALRARGACVAPAVALYTSPLQRACRTAQVLSDLWRLERHADADLREIYCGELEGMPIAEVQTRYSDLWQRNLAQTDDDFAWPGGESYHAFRQRVLQALARISHRHRGQRVAIVTHAGAIAQVMNALRGRPAAVWSMDRPDPLTLTTVEWTGHTPSRLLGFSERCA